MQILTIFVRLLGLFAALLSWSSLHCAAAEEGIRIGVAPHTSTRVILELYQPLRLFLETQLHEPVEILTAPDFTEFARRAVAQHYDIAITTGHQAQMLRADSGYIPLVTYKADFKALIVVPASMAEGTAPSALDGTTVLGLNPSSLVTIWGQHWLADHKIKPDQMRYVSAADSVAQLILSGDASAGCISLANFQKLPDAIQDKLRILVQSPPLAGRVYMLNGRLSRKTAAIKSALAAFAASPQGQKYFADNQLDGYRDIEAAELQGMDAYADEVRKVLHGVGH